MLTAVVHIDPVKHVIVGYKDLTDQEFWVRGHMPGFPLLPGVLMCEAAAQLCSFYYSSQKIGDAGGLLGLGGLDEARFLRQVRPGERLVMVGTGVKVHRRMTQVPRRRDGRRREGLRDARHRGADREAGGIARCVNPGGSRPRNSLRTSGRCPRPRNGARRQETGDRRQWARIMSPVSLSPASWIGLATTLRQLEPGRDRGRHGEGALPPQLRPRAAGDQLLRHRDRPQVPALRHHALRRSRIAEREDGLRRCAVGVPAIRSAGQRRGGPRLLSRPVVEGAAQEAARLHERLRGRCRADSSRGRSAPHRHGRGGILRRDDRDHPRDAGLPGDCVPRRVWRAAEEAGFQTNFERKARQKGTPIWRAEFERTSGPVTEATDPDA